MSDMIQSPDAPICARCVLPEAKPHIVFDAEGVCSICREYEKEKAVENEAKLLESDLLKILNKHKGKGKYDCLAMCSGGKDSTSALYYMKKRYGMNPLAFMFDNGFETEDAINNVRRAADRLGVDFLFFKTNYMKDMFQKILTTDSPVIPCHPCSMWYIDLAYETAARYDIPIIIAGWTKGQSTNQKIMTKCGCNAGSPEFKEMSAATEDFITKYVKNDPKYKDFPTSMAEVLKKANGKHKSLVLSPHWFLPYDASVYVEVIKNELGWEYPKLSYPGRSTNCTMNFISVYNSFKYYGYTHYHVEMSKMIRQGMLTRDEALKDLKLQLEKADLNKIAKKLNYEFT